MAHNVTPVFPGAAAFLKPGSPAASVVAPENIGIVADSTQRHKMSRIL
jgi:hypothetical protein